MYDPFIFVQGFDKNRLFTNKVKAYLDSEESKLQKKAIYPLPANATNQSLPKKALKPNHQWQLSDNDKWMQVYVAGIKYWVGNVSHTTKLGEVPPEDAVFTPPPPSVERITDEIRKVTSDAVTNILDRMAQSWEYTNFERLLLRNNSPNTQLAAEASAGMQYDADIWDKIGELQEEVLQKAASGELQMPESVTDTREWVNNNIISQLPAAPKRPEV